MARRTQRSRRTRAKKNQYSPLGILVLLITVVLAFTGISFRVSPELAAFLPEELRSVLAPIITPQTSSPTEVASAPGDLPRTAKSFSSAKRILYEEIYRDRQVTFYCGCRYNSDRQIDLDSCGVVPRKNAKRAQRVEAEHVFPAYQFGNFRQCWREPEKVCGKKMSGRECCEKSDPVFIAAHNDLHNLFPAVGEVNGDRSNYNWGMIPGEKRSYGKCDIEVDSSIRRAEPPDYVKGDIARTMFYMAETYNFRLSNQDQQLYNVWHREDPVDAWEIQRNRRIAEIQGRGNRFVEN